jgi:hypothetical protein
VLLPSPEACHVYLAPNSARFAHVRRWGGKSSIFEIELPEVARLETLGGALEAFHMPIKVMLSARFAHILLLPFHASLNSTAEWEGYAQHACVTMFGERAQGWRIRLSRQGYGAPVVAVAMEESLYQGIDTQMNKQGRRVAAITSYCTDVFDRHRRALGRDFWLFIVEVGTCTCWYGQEGVIRSVLAHPLETDWRSSLAAFIARELAKKGDADPVPVFLHAVEPIQFSDAELPGIMVHMLTDEVLP